MEEKSLAEDLQTEDIFEATHKAKEKSMKLLEEQGITTVALALSKFLVEFTEHPEEVLQKVG